ncbi:MAG: ABC transporter permease [Actinobacteria bacterium]|nr:ABC transporter permease [Actinomycetota bacterium]
MMLKKIWIIFIRDLKVNMREFMTLFMIIIPLILAVGINFLSPGINDTSVNLALIENENPGQADYFDDFAHIGLFSDVQRVEDRVMSRDDVVGILPKDNGYYIMTQGNEPESVLEYAKLLNVLYESDIQLEDAHSEIIEFGRTVPPLKKMLVNVLLLFVSMFSGMLIAMNILEEKVDQTVSAINVTPTSRRAFILGKGLTGMTVALFSSIACLLITGFYNINLGQAVLVVFSTTILSLLIGFIQGLNSDDVMEAAGSVKLMFLPMAGSIAGYEFVTGNWQIFFYWSPFYWAYRANDMILSKSGTWPQLILYVGIILAICGLVYALLAPRIIKGLQ